MIATKKLISPGTYQRSPGHNSGSTGQEIAPHYIFKNRRFSAALTSDDGNLWKIDGRIDAGGHKRILQLVDDFDELIHLCVFYGKPIGTLFFAKCNFYLDQRIKNYEFIQYESIYNTDWFRCIGL